MKKIILFLICGVMIISITGCQNSNNKNDNINSSIEDNGSINFKDKISEYAYYTTMKCDAFEEIKYFDNGWFVSNNNDIYEYNIYQLYSNDSNCKQTDEKLPDNIVFVDRKASWNSNNYSIDNKMAYISSDKKVYLFDTQKKKLNTDIINGTALRYTLRYSNNALVQNGYSKFHFLSRLSAYATKHDNNIYYVTLEFDDNINSTEDATITSEEIIFTLPQGEKIVDFYFDTSDVCASEAGPGNCVRETNSQYTNEITGKKYGIPENNTEMFIETEENYYRIMLANEECEKYIDVDCRYEWRKDKDITKIKEQILYRDDSYLITKDGRVYSSLGYGY